MKKLLAELEIRNFVIAVKKNPKGQEYSRRIRWRLHSKIYDTYKKIDDTNQKFILDSKIL